MPSVKKTKKLRKELKFFDVFALAAGTTLSSGFFLLPGLAAEEAGPAIVIAYIIAAVPLVPAMFSIVELATAMPRAGGVYYFLDRTLGPVVGTIGGIGTWLALLLKVAFALIGMGAYLSIFMPSISISLTAIVIAVLIGLINLYSLKGSGSLQVFLVTGLLLILAVFIGGGIPVIHTQNFKGFFDAGAQNILSTAGLVYISYIGITKVASLSEEVKNPEKNLPLGVFSSLGTAFLIYVLGTIVMVGVIPMNILKGDLTPVATAANLFLGRWGEVLLSVAALFAFVSVANAGTLSASRYPFAMSRDRIFPHFFQRLSRRGTPVFSTLITVSLIIIILLLFEPTKIAKLASAFQLLMFALVCMAVIVMRESKINSYDPGYKSPFYPWMQILGIVTPLILIFEMGWIAMSFSGGLVIIGTLWFTYYAKSKVVRTGAIYHVFERLGKSRYHALDSELRGILKEKGLRESDPFDEIVARSYVLDLEQKSEFEEVTDKASLWISQLVSLERESINKLFLEGTRLGATPVTHGIALPHMRLEGLEQAEMVLVRCKEGIHIKFKNPLTDFQEDEQIVYAVFFLVSPEKDPTQHLRILAQIAGRVEEENFFDDWTTAEDEQKLKEVLLRDERCMSLTIQHNTSSKKLIGLSLREIKFPVGCLVALLRREGVTIIPNGKTVFQDEDRLTIIGNKEGLDELRKRYSENYH